ncbi:hypothetical protein [Paraburkholderia haematera]|uniref:HEAT repeat domain-containing protein n=1 Tax=Paraburkholderia haematera TaxID=2793077 RepID=A0ABN7LE77_9BURK|nr:hypothetical protein [Paraburkholderia haematera]CAE6745364.1 hypothetical protein R69888_02704 [Paraburkholderia haematera]
MTQTSYTTRYLRSAALLFWSLFIFFHGCPFTKKHAAGKIAVRDNREREVKVGNTNVNVNDPAVWMNPYYVSSPIYREFNEYGQWLVTNRELAAASNTTRPADLLMLSGQLAAKGYARLPTDLLEQHLPLVGKILASLDPHTCSEFIRGRLSDIELNDYAYPVMNTFSDTEAKAWFLTSKSAVIAQLHGSPPIVLSTENATQGILKIAKSMSEPQAKAFISGLANLKNESNEDACATARTLYFKGDSLPEPYRGYMARLLLTMQMGVRNSE